MAQPTAAIAVSSVALSILAAATVKLTSTSVAARAELGFTFPGPSRRPAQVVEVAGHNTRLAAAALIACVAVELAPRVRLALDIAFTGLLAFNAGVVGVAWGAYGTQLLRTVAPHGAIELAAFALCGGAYLRARGGPLPPRQLVLVAAVAAVLLVTAAIVESYLALGGSSR